MTHPTLPQFPNAPKTTLGMVGGGRVWVGCLCMKRKALGFKVAVFEPEAGSPAGSSGRSHIQAAYDDAQVCSSWRSTAKLHHRV